MLTSPLRYPGGKAKLYPFFVELVKKNNLYGSSYSEPYAGGAGLAIKLLCSGFVNEVYLNDIDNSIYCFWLSVLKIPTLFCDMIDKTPVTIAEWYRQKEVWQKGDVSNPLELGFAAYFLNRTNRSGIIDGAGPIGGYSQLGCWKVDVRFNKAAQIENIMGISSFSKQIHISNMDALEFIENNITRGNGLMYLDPPYYVKGKKLYKNFYKHSDHEEIYQKIKRYRSCNWVTSYDDVFPIRQIYSDFSPISYSLNYSAGKKGTGREVIYVSDGLLVPELSGYEVAA